MADRFSQHIPELQSPFAYLAAVTPSDTTDLPVASRALWVGTPGDLRVTTVGGTTETIPNVSGWVPGRISRVWAAGTEADGIVAFW